VALLMHSPSPVLPIITVLSFTFLPALVDIYWPAEIMLKSSLPLFPDWNPRGSVWLPLSARFTLTVCVPVSVSVKTLPLPAWVVASVTPISNDPCFHPADYHYGWSPRGSHYGVALPSPSISLPRTGPAPPPQNLC
jgi:hypothetical protein